MNTGLFLFVSLFTISLCCPTEEESEKKDKCSEVEGEGVDWLEKSPSFCSPENFKKIQQENFFLAKKLQDLKVQKDNLQVEKNKLEHEKSCLEVENEMTKQRFGEEKKFLFERSNRLIQANEGLINDRLGLQNSLGQCQREIKTSNAERDNWKKKFDASWGPQSLLVMLGCVGLTIVFYKLFIRPMLLEDFQSTTDKLFDLRFPSSFRNQGKELELKKVKHMPPKRKKIDYEKEKEKINREFDERRKKILLGEGIKESYFKQETRKNNKPRGAKSNSLNDKVNKLEDDENDEYIFD